ncbi:Transforming acidic coiled-coil-containing protein 2 [Orchesella cincta]|uniref:Transforming acidic coiled-coil-containing protein 2 n=1 Tax=Orchesella cincta TaxID=48709 RepID=A0A1D2MYV2_ORCCI|nr:Transforming acidic coiled-coil-containing protein 2 [Orchesella cincta]
MSKDYKSTGDASEEKGLGSLKRADNNLNFEAEALKALENSLMQQEQAIVRRNLQKQEAKRRVSSMIDSLCSKEMSKLSEFRQRNAAVNDESRSVISERDQALQDLRNTELAFSDVHRKYERAKAVVENLKKNEDHLKQRDEEMLLMMDSRDQKFQAFKQEAHLTVEKMYGDYQGKLTNLEGDNAKLAAQLRRTEMRAEMINSELEQKHKENLQLNTLADELMGGKARDNMF